MGYDIHVYLEIKDDEGKWHAFGSAKTAVDNSLRTTLIFEEVSDYILRDYNLFGLLSGVHVSDEDKQSGKSAIMFPSPRGLPEDLSDGLKDTFSYNEMCLNVYSSDTHFTMNDLLVSYATYQELTDFGEKSLSQDVIAKFKSDIAEGSEVTKWSIPYTGKDKFNENDHMITEITWADIPEDRKRVIWCYDW